MYTLFSLLLSLSLAERGQTTSISSSIPENKKKHRTPHVLKQDEVWDNSDRESTDDESESIDVDNFVSTSHFTPGNTLVVNMCVCVLI